MTAWNRIQRTQRTAKLGEIIALPTPTKPVLLLLDAKHFRIQKITYTLYVAFDATHCRPLCWVLLPRYELRSGYDLLLSFLQSKQCRIYAVVSDWHKGLRASVSDHHPNLVHQRCAAHVLQEVLRRLGGKRWITTGYGQEHWPIFRKIALEFQTEQEAENYLVIMKRKYPLYYRGYRVLEKALPGIYQFTKSEKVVVRTSNRIENFMGILEQRLKTFRGMKTPETLIQIVSSFIKIKYKRPTN